MIQTRLEQLMTNTARILFRIIILASNHDRSFACVCAPVPEST